MALPSGRDPQIRLRSCGCRRILGAYQSTGLEAIGTGAAGYQLEGLPPRTIFESRGAAARFGPVCPGPPPQIGTAKRIDRCPLGAQASLPAPGATRHDPCNRTRCLVVYQSVALCGAKTTEKEAAKTMRFNRIALAVSIALLIATSAANVQARNPADEGAKHGIAAKDLKARLDGNQKTIIIDARDTLNGQMIKGALHVPSSKLEDWAKT